MALMKRKNWSEDRRVRSCKGVRLRSESGGQIAHVRGTGSRVTERWLRHSSGCLLPRNKLLRDLVAHYSFQVQSQRGGSAGLGQAWLVLVSSLLCLRLAGRCLALAALGWPHSQVWGWAGCWLRCWEGPDVVSICHHLAQAGTENVRNLRSPALYWPK